MKKLIAIALILIAFVGGYAVGRHNTIISASLYDIADDGSYYLEFNGQIHEYN